METSRRKEMIAALALLALTGSVVVSNPVFAGEQVARPQKSEDAEASALNILNSIDVSFDSSENMVAKIEQAKKLLEDATKQMPNKAGSIQPTCL